MSHVLPIAIACALAAAPLARADAPAGRYTVDGEAVRDNVTGLVWQRDVAAEPLSWSAATNYCASLSLGGWSRGWRLPTVKELQSIVDYRAADPAVDASAFPATPLEIFWSSTPDASLPTCSWAVDFRTGDAGVKLTSEALRPRCVR